MMHFESNNSYSLEIIEKFIHFLDYKTISYIKFEILFMFQYITIIHIEK